MMDGMSLTSSPPSGLATLSPAQRHAVEIPGNMVIFACPGSGKTHTLATKAQVLLQKNPRHRLCAVTFTNESASELRERILRSVPSAKPRLHAGTFHALCLEQMKANGIRKVALLSPFEQAGLMRDAWKRAAPGEKFEDVVKVIEHGKSTLTPRLDNVDSNPLEAAFQCYQEQLERFGKMDFADLIRDTVLGMREGRIRPLDVQYMLVDEFQDADEVQLEWVMLHVHAGVEVTVVGDDDQSLYGWRHALGYAGMRRFQEASHATLVNLDTCYRCAPRILAHSRALIECNRVRQGKELQAARDIDGQVAVMAFRDEVEQVQALCEQVQWVDGTWAILARTNAGLDAVDSMLTAHGIPFTRLGGKRFWDNSWPSFYLAVLRSLATGERLGIDFLIARLSLSEEAREVYRHHVTSGPANTLDALLRNRPPLSGLPPNDAELLGGWLDTIQRWVVAARGPRPSLVLMDVADRLVGVLGKGSVDVMKVCHETLARMKGALMQRINTLMRRQADERGKADGDILLMTLHTAKGLEFDNVWMVNVEEDTLPHRKGDLEEERRLAYVGFTRARRNLVVSYRKTRISEGGKVDKLTPSRFIHEAGLLTPL